MSVRIFGDELPKLVFTDLTVDYNELESQLHITVKHTPRDVQLSVKTSILTGKRHVVRKGSYASLELTVMLPTDSTWAFDVHLAALLAREGEPVTVYPTRDSNQVWTGHLLAVKPFYYDDDTAYHAYTLTVQSDDYAPINLADTLPDNTAHAVDHDGNRLVDSDGNSLVLKFNSEIIED